MGGDEDVEPIPKRIKLTSDHRDLSSSLSNAEPLPVSSSNIMSHPVTAEGDEGILGSRGLIRRSEFVRIIAEALYSLGYVRTGAYLEEESGISLHSSEVNLFLQQIRNGNWDGSLATLKNMGQLDENMIKSASFLIFEQKFLELLDGDRVMDALWTLRTEIAPLRINTNINRELSSYLLSVSQCEVVGSPSQNTLRAKSRPRLLRELQKLLPRFLIIRERRLEELVEQALYLQKYACEFHNSMDKQMSLYSNHSCGRDRLPSQTMQILQEHDDEVWFLQFSHSGKYLASASSDQSTIIWEVNENGQMSLKHRLFGHDEAVSSVSWSPDDHQLLTCGLDQNIMRWHVSSGECLHVYENNAGFVSCCWFPDGRWILSGLKDKSIRMWDLEGNEIVAWTESWTLRISDLEITSDGKQIILICKENRILLFDRESEVQKSIEENSIITSFSLSRDNKFLLVSLINQEIHLWHIKGVLQLVEKYRGHTRNRFVIRACFGGLNDAFIASGSEDSQVYIWNKKTGKLIEALAGHSGAVNCVSWNPANPQMLASASDDRTIRIWT